jgi:glycosyltransferase involved in cell wall biosynthesis
MEAIALIEAPDHPSARFRLLPFAPALARAGCSLTLRPIPRGALSKFRLFSGLGRFDVVLLQRQLLSVPELLYLRAMARRLIYDFDDAMLYRDSYHPRGHLSRQRAGRFTATVRSADSIIAGNTFLKECAISSGAAPEKIRVIPMCVEPEKYPPRPELRREGIELVWTGSSSTIAGLELKRPLLERIGREVPCLRLRLICDRFDRFGPLSAMPVVKTSWSPAAEIESLVAADIGISWVPDDIWTRGKGATKLLHYGAARLPSITNPAGMHPEIIRDGFNGIFAGTDDQWIAAVRRLKSDPEFRQAMGSNARAVVERTYSVAAQTEALVSTIVN